MARILVVDDEASMRRLLKEILTQDKHDILEAETGAQACTLFRQQSADLIITDLVMPEVNGIDLIMELKKEFPDIRIIAISGGGGITGRFDYLAIAKLIGAKHVIGKPFQVAELRAVVNQVLAD